MGDIVGVDMTMPRLPKFVARFGNSQSKEHPNPRTISNQNAAVIPEDHANQHSNDIRSVGYLITLRASERLLSRMVQEGRNPPKTFRIRDATTATLTHLRRKLVKRASE